MNSGSGNRLYLHSPLQSNKSTDKVDESYIESRDEVTLKNGATYVGQWLGKMKHGYGTQVWSDGAKYEGNWKFNRANGHGKFWHISGDIFEGEWKNDKANGYGIYTHANGI